MLCKVWQVDILVLPVEHVTFRSVSLLVNMNCVDTVMNAGAFFFFFTLHRYKTLCSLNSSYKKKPSGYLVCYFFVL